MLSVPHHWEFAKSERLWILLGVLALAALYVWQQRRRSEYETRFSDVALLASVMPKRPGWRRHVPATLLVLTLAALTTGFARPSADIKVRRDKATIIVALDVSSSMTATDVEPSRIEAAETAAAAFIRGLPAGFKVGLVSFNRTAVLNVPPVLDKAAVADAIPGLKLDGGTAIGDAVSVAVHAAQDNLAKGDTSPVRIVLLSDGGNTSGVDPAVSAQEAVAAGMPVTTIAYGTPQGVVAVNGNLIPVPVDKVALATLAQTTGGQTYTALSSKGLKAVYDSIRKEAGTEQKRRELTSWLTGLALLLGIAAAAASLVWFRTLP